MFFALSGGHVDQMATFVVCITLVHTILRYTIGFSFNDNGL